ncbi:flagellar export protein FliJ [Rubrivivax rivuli]|uniref:Flagellar FliJ protein n=1 Tax=Rubrivivax rivuli TaxID=1862385 RepID=A0A437R8G2_9BURK|nr:flagellar export protein FliJ [Rubrivivax rivuli]RVU43025.1 flagellar export protein FliJ [Rubrivivax rivuli]
MTAALHTLLEHAERERDEAVSALLQAEEHHRRLLAQQEQLLAYREDYRARHPAQGGRSASIELIRCHQGFMQRLDQALQQQQHALLQTEARVGELRQALVAQETRVASVRKLLERRGTQARHLAERQDQRRSDETAMHQHRRRNEDGGAGGWRLGFEAAPLPH